MPLLDCYGFIASRHETECTGTETAPINGTWRFVSGGRRYPAATRVSLRERGFIQRLTFAGIGATHHNGTNVSQIDFWLLEQLVSYAGWFAGVAGVLLVAGGR